MSDKPKPKSLRQLAADLKVSRSTLNYWKHQGAPVEDGKDAVEAWAMESGKRGQDSATIEEARLQVLNQTARRLKLANDEKERRLADKNDVVFMLNKGMAAFAQELDKFLKVNAPPALVGLDAVAIAKYLAEHADKFFAQFKSELERFGRNGE